jgi:oligoribonuclease
MQAIFLDIETTGLDPYQHRPIDLAFKVLDLKSGALLATYRQIINLSYEVWERHDPVSIQINGYSFEEISTGKNSVDVSKDVINILTDLGVERGKTVFICQNPAFDRAFFDHIVPVYTQEKLNWPYHWLDLASMYWAFYLKDLHLQGLPIPDRLNLSKNEIGKRYGIPPEEGPHRAMNGVDHLIQCYNAVNHH